MALNDYMYNFFKRSVDVFRGLQGYTVQSFVEANVKNGVQFEYSNAPADLAAGTSVDYIFTTPASVPVLVKERAILTDAGSITATTFEGATFTGGTAGAIYNLNRLIPTASGSVLRTGATVTATGTQVFAQTHGLANTSGADVQRTTTSATTGLERALKANTQYLLRITNTGTATARVRLYITWYEGGLSNAV